MVSYSFCCFKTIYWIKILHNIHIYCVYQLKLHALLTKQCFRPSTVKPLFFLRLFCCVKTSNWSPVAPRKRTLWCCAMRIPRRTSWRCCGALVAGDGHGVVGMGGCTSETIQICKYVCIYTISQEHCLMMFNGKTGYFYLLLLFSKLWWFESTGVWYKIILVRGCRRSFHHRQDID